MHRLFPSQQPDENIHMVFRQHWFFLITKLSVIVLLFAIWIAYRAFVPSLMPGLFEGTAGQVESLVSQIYLMALLAGTFIIWVLYYLNVNIVTDIRVVDIDQNNLFSRDISEFHIDKIEDVTSKTNGVLGNILQFGTVYLQTAGAIDRIEFNNVANPEKIVKVILDLYEDRPKRSHNSK